MRSGKAGSPCPGRVRRRHGFTVIELMVVAGLFSLVLVYALDTVHHQKRAVESTTRVAHLQEVRRLITLVTRDLQQAVAIEKPGWASVTSDVEFLDATHTRVKIMATDATGNRLETLEAMTGLARTAPVHLVREAVKPDGTTQKTQLDRDLALGWVRFYRLGRSLLGIRLALKPDPDALVPAQRAGEEFSFTVALNRQVH